MKLDAYRDTILIVDDNLDIRVFAQMLLERAGYSVVTAADGEEGLRYYKTHQSNIVLLLTDVMMPNMNGLELADRVLGLDSQLPVLFMSGDVWGADRGFGCVVKPFKSAELVARVNRVLDAKAPFRDIGRPLVAPSAQHQL
jgi:two-component system cell cycle sensor histidine kinase/response regulator CckA